MAKKSPYNAADESLSTEASQRYKSSREQELEDIKTILADPSGVRLFRRMFDTGKIFETTFTGNSNTFFLEGHRNLALMFFNDICLAAPNIIPKLMISDEENS